MIENGDLTSQTRAGDEVKELELSSSALDFLKVGDALTPKVSRSTDETQYPDYYGGAYIDNKGRLIILVTEKPGNYKQIFRKIIGHKDFLVQKCDYSYNQLVNCMKEIDLFRDNNSEYFKDVSNLYYISDSENKVYVTLKKFDKTSIEEFKDRINNFSGIEFTELEGDLYLTSELNPGMPVLSVFPIGGGSASTLGFRAKKNGVEGVVVSGHSSRNGGKLHIDIPPTEYIGTCTVPIIGGSVDCAFVPVDVGTPSNKIYGTQNILSAQTNSPGAGTFVNFKGRYTSEGGPIVSTSASATFKFPEDPTKSYNYSNLTSVNLPVVLQHGDSGGIVYSYVSATNTRYNLGNIVGYGTTNGLAYFSKTSQIIIYLGITLY